jgi:hypothetical protein
MPMCNRLLIRSDEISPRSTYKFFRFRRDPDSALHVIVGRDQARLRSRSGSDQLHHQAAGAPIYRCRSKGVALSRKNRFPNLGVNFMRRFCHLGMNSGPSAARYSCGTRMAALVIKTNLAGPKNRETS